jgi:hypothetical protein
VKAEVRPTTEPVRASADWLSLREAADAAARSPELVDELRTALAAGHETLTVHDLGCGTGSMARWLAGQLPGRQRWVLHDRDEALLDRALEDPPRVTADGAPVAVETRASDITFLEPAELSSADLVTASALLDMLTADELERLVASCVAASCPVLITLSVVGLVELSPADPLDRLVMAAFNAHQQRRTPGGALLGPIASRAAADSFTRRGLDVLVRPSPWRLGREDTALLTEWLSGWLRAACEQQPELREVVAGGYAEVRRGQIAEGSLSVTVHHEDLLVRRRAPGMPALVRDKVTQQRPK